MRHPSMRKQRGEAWLTALCICGPLAFAIMMSTIAWGNVQKERFKHEMDLAKMKQECPAK